MGYTHYFEQEGPSPTDEQWEVICSEVRELFAKHAAIICVEFNRPEDPPELSSRRIAFNGKGTAGHETFILRRQQKGFDFCKTERKPYDEVVIEVLKIVRRHCPRWLRLASDGGDSVFAESGGADELQGETA